MKKLFFIVGIITCCLSCSSNDDSNGSQSSATFLPLTIGNYWTYNVEGQTTGYDSLYISNDTIIASNTYKKFKTSELPTGFYSNAMRNNGVRKVDDKLLLSGSVNFNGNSTLPVNLDLSIVDFTIFDEDATENSTLSTSNGSFNQDVEGYPLNGIYILTSKAGQFLANFTSPNGDTYQDVKTIKIVLNLKLSTSLQGLPITVLSAQDVLVSTLYVAKDIGVVYANTDTSYQLNALVAQEFGIPASGTQNQKELLENYNVD